MKKDTPISLFSFQDIITCLTGIMIVVVLIILLQLVEAMTKHAAASPLAEEVKELRQREKELAAVRDSLLSGGESIDEEVRQYAAFSAEELKMMLQNSEKQLKVLNEENEQLEAQILDMKLNDEKLDKQITETEKDLKKIEEREKKIQEKYRELAEKTKQRENLAKEIERRKKTVRIEVAGSSDLIPVLVECNTWGFRVKQTASGEITTIGSRNSVLSKHISELSTVLKKFNRNNVFIILLFKPGTLRYLRDVESAARGFELGKELVLDEEEIL